MSGPKNWSVSAAQRYEACALAFKYQYVDRIPRPASEVPIHWRKGTVVHAALEAVWRKRLAEKGVGPMWTVDNWEVAKAALAKAWAEEEMPEPGLSEGVWDDTHLAVETTLRAEVESYEHILGVEEKLFIRAGMNIIGYADLLRRPTLDTIHIRDWKVRKKASLPQDLEKDFQLNLYGAMIRRLHPWVRTIEASHYNPPTAVEVKVTLDPMENEAALHRIQAIRDAVRYEDQWLPDKGTVCESCAYKPICPAWKKSGPEEAMSLNADLF